MSLVEFGGLLLEAGDGTLADDPNCCCVIDCCGCICLEMYHATAIDPTSQGRLKAVFTGAIACEIIMEAKNIFPFCIRWESDEGVHGCFGECAFNDINSIQFFCPIDEFGEGTSLEEMVLAITVNSADCFLILSEVIETICNPFIWKAKFVASEVFGGACICPPGTEVFVEITAIDYWPCIEEFVLQAPFENQRMNRPDDLPLNIESWLRGSELVENGLVV